MTNSPAFKARLTGVLYLVIFVFAPNGAESATPTKMVVTLACDVGVALLLYALLRPVHKTTAAFAAFFRLLFVAAMGMNALNLFGIVNLWGGVSRASTFDMGYGISLIPFGVHCLLIGSLIYKSSYLPKTLGVLMLVAGLAYSTFVWPSLAQKIFFPYIVVPGVVGEGALTLWLLVMAVNSEKWVEREVYRVRSP